VSRGLLALALAVALLAAPAGAQERASLPDIEDEVMCVTCNVPLFIAESPQASRQREYIRGLIDQGLTKEQIKARLVGEYGEDVLALPEEDGVGLAAYAVPIATFVALIAIFLLLVPRWRRRGREPALAGTPGTAAAAAIGATDAELARLDDDLRRGG
jgi:cytochrome c-type biogenesis protein CcmH